MKKKRKGKAKREAQGPEAILERALKLFDKRSYPAAMREFEKARSIAHGEDIAEKIEICRRETEKIRAGDLVKRARKSAKRGQLDEALHCYEEAHRITGKPWIAEAAGRLRETLQGQDSLKAARDAEEAGDYPRAAELYAQAQAGQGKEAIQRKRARCLVLGERYEEAIAVIEDLTARGPGELYDYGFALAQRGRYFECLKLWERIDSPDERFLEQMSHVRSCLETDLFDRFERAEDTAGICEQGRYLLINAPDRRDLRALVDYCKVARLERLWVEERFGDIAGMIFNDAPETGPEPEPEPALISLRAKTAFKLAEETGEHLGELAVLWLTAVYRETAQEGPSDSAERDEVRRELTQRTEALIKRHAASGDREAERNRICWEIEKGLLEALQRLAGAGQESARLVCTPRFAARFGLSAGVLGLIRANRNAFESEDHYLRTGSYYSAAMESLFAVETGDLEKSVARLPEEKSGDEFVRYGVMRVNFGCGMACLERGEGKAGRHFENVSDLFALSPEYERRLTEKATDCDDEDALRSYEGILREVRRKRASKPIDKALSMVMSNRALLIYNRGAAGRKILDAAAKKALVLDPGNELARGILEDMRVDIEIRELKKALQRQKMNRACRIAAETGHPRVKKLFFDFFERSLDSLDGPKNADLGRREKLRLLKDFHDWCSRVDEDHPLLEDIQLELDDLE